MPMERDTHEGLLEELMNPELEHSRRTEILQLLRTDYNDVITNDTEKTTENEKLRNEKNDLLVSNSKLFRQLGVVGTPNEEIQEKKEFSETVTLTDLEKE